MTGPIKGINPTTVGGPNGTYIAPFDVPAGKGFLFQAMKYRQELMFFKIWVLSGGAWTQLAGPLGVSSNSYVTIFDIPSDQAARSCGVSGRWKGVTPPWPEWEASFNHIEYRAADALGYDGWIWTGNPATEYWNTSYQIRFT